MEDFIHTAELCNFAYLKDLTKTEYYTDEEINTFLKKRENRLATQFKNRAKLNKSSTTFRNKRPITSYLRTDNHLFKNKKVNKLFETVINPYKPSGAIIKNRFAKKYSIPTV